MTKEEEKEYNKQYYKEHKEQMKIYYKQYCLTHREEINERRKQYYLTHREEAKQYNLEHLDYRKQWRKDNPDKVRVEKSKRRQLGFIPLNSYKPYEEGYVFHHNDKIGYGVYMLEKDHTSIWHNIFTGKGMDEINALAMNYLN